MLKIGTLREGMGFEMHPEYNRLQCVIIGPMEDAVGDEPRGVVGRVTGGYPVRWANGEEPVVGRRYLRPIEEPPAAAEGEKAILDLFKAKENTHAE